MVRGFARVFIFYSSARWPQGCAHAELETTPLARSSRLRYYAPVPTAALRAAFRMEVTRKLRRSDATVSLAGRRFEVPARYRHLQCLHLRYARWDLGTVDPDRCAPWHRESRPAGLHR